MVKNILLNKYVKQVGLYQAALIASRVVGLLRDMLIVLFLGTTLITDQLFFLFSFTDILMTVLIGGGAIVYVSRQLAVDSSDKEKLKTVHSSILFYFSVSILIIMFEVSTNNFIGNLLFQPLQDNKGLNTSYFIALFSLLFAAPLVGFYGYFLHIEKLYLQPFLNFIFTIVLILLLSTLFLLDNLSPVHAALILLLSTAIRFFIAYMVFKKWSWGITNWFQLHLHSAPKFYRDLFLSGLSAGLLVVLPYLFRAELPLYGEGLYAVATLAFRVSDLVLALLIVPLTLIFIGKVDINSNLKLLGYIATFFILGMIFPTLYFFLQLLGGNSWVELLGTDLELLNNIILSHALMVLSYGLSMLLIQKHYNKTAAVISLAVMLIFLFSKDLELLDLNMYFYLFYSVYVVYIFLALSLLVVGMANRLNFNDLVS